MKIFTRQTHLLTRFSAGVFALYLLIKEQKKQPEDRDDVTYYGSMVMLGFDAYTFMET
jgi:hypothetical protein